MPLRNVTFHIFLGSGTALESGILKIYSACETGLAPGKSVKVSYSKILFLISIGLCVRKHQINTYI